MAEPEPSSEEAAGHPLSAVVHGLLWGAALATLVVLLGYTLHYRVLRQAEWNELEHIGQFWSGMFGSLALFGLVLGWRQQYRKQLEDKLNFEHQMAIQQKKHAEDLRNFESQMALLRSDLSLRNFMFVRERVVESGKGFEFDVTADSGGLWAHRTSITGLAAYLEEHLTDDDLQDNVVVDRIKLKHYILLADWASKLISQLPDDMQHPCRESLSDWYPESLRHFWGYFEATDMRCREWILQDLAAFKDQQEVLPEIRALLDLGWEFQRLEALSGYIVTASLRKPGYLAREVCSNSLQNPADSWRDAIREIRKQIDNPTHHSQQGELQS
jgi:hypothetical protein